MFYTICDECDNTQEKYNSGYHLLITHSTNTPARNRFIKLVICIVININKNKNIILIHF